MSVEGFRCGSAAGRTDGHQGRARPRLERPGPELLLPGAPGASTGPPPLGAQGLMCFLVAHGDGRML